MTHPGFRDAIATGRDWAEAAGACAAALGACGGPGRLGFLYVTERLAPDLGGILSLLREATGVETWVGGAGTGICGRRREVHGETPAVSAMVAGLPPDSFRLLGSLVRGGDMPEPDVLDWVGPVSPVLGIVHGDADNSQLGWIVEDLTDLTEGYLVGGLTGGGQGAAVPTQLAGLPTRGGLSGVLISGHVPVAVAGTQGCVPVGDYHTVTETSRAAIARLDGRRPLDILCEETGAHSREDLRALAGVVHVGLPVGASDVGAFTVRPLMAVDPRTGWIATGARLEPGDRLCFVRRTQEAAETDMRAMLKRLRARLDGRPPRGGIYVSCHGRGPELFGGRDREMTLIAEELGDFPLTGFFGGGEIRHNQLYTHSGVLTVFR
ncbi:FIST N-terminal domain-containing protein [Caenispirillum salinarum]|uniref:FIST signal transduction protein n=1 Tax=Caenispirillum salinarum TaxID=859058 RepID=UPI00384F6F7F